MADDNAPPDGIPYREAVLALCDPEFRRKYEAAPSKPEQRVIPSRWMKSESLSDAYSDGTNWVRGGGRGSIGRRNPQSEDPVHPQDAALTRMVQDFWNKLRTGTNIGFGCPGSATAPSEEIPSSEWARPTRLLRKAGALVFVIEGREWWRVQFYARATVEAWRETRRGQSPGSRETDLSAGMLPETRGRKKGRINREAIPERVAKLCLTLPDGIDARVEQKYEALVDAFPEYRARAKTTICQYIKEAGPQTRRMFSELVKSKTLKPRGK